MGSGLKEQSWMSTRPSVAYFPCLSGSLSDPNRLASTLFHVTFHVMQPALVLWMALGQGVGYTLPAQKAVSADSLSAALPVSTGADSSTSTLAVGPDVAYPRCRKERVSRQLAKIVAPASLLSGLVPDWLAMGLRPHRRYTAQPSTRRFYVRRPNWVSVRTRSRSRRTASAAFLSGPDPPGQSHPSRNTGLDCPSTA